MRAGRYTLTSKGRLTINAILAAQQANPQRLAELAEWNLRATRWNKLLLVVRKRRKSGNGHRVEVRHSSIERVLYRWQFGFDIIAGTIPGADAMEMNPEKPAEHTMKFTMRTWGIIIIVTFLGMQLNPNNTWQSIQQLRSDSEQVRRETAVRLCIDGLFLATGVGLVVTDFVRRKRRR
jgi:hypothetical protein